MDDMVWFLSDCGWYGVVLVLCIPGGGKPPWRVGSQILTLVWM